MSSFYLGTPNKNFHEFPEIMKHFTKPNLACPNCRGSIKFIVNVATVSNGDWVNISQISPNSEKKIIPRWVKVTFVSPSWRSLNLSKRSLNHPKKVTLNHQALRLGVVFNYNQNVVSNDLTWVHDCSHQKSNMWKGDFPNFRLGTSPNLYEHLGTSAFLGDLCWGLGNHVCWVTSHHWIVELGYFFKKKMQRLGSTPPHAGCQAQVISINLCLPLASWGEG